VEVKKTMMMVNIVLPTSEGESHHLEVSTIMVAEEIADKFFEALGA